MCDLISRSKLLKEIETWGGCVEALHEYISNMPTAYNVEAVVAELERFSLDATPYCNAMDGNLCDGMSDCDFCKIQHAIDIVRKGGAE